MSNQGRGIQSTDPRDTTQEQRREHLRELGWSENLVNNLKEIPYEVMFLAHRPLTHTEKVTGLTINPTNLGD